MTNQEAIRILDEQRNKFMDEWVDFGGVNEAYNMAIQALKEQEAEIRQLKLALDIAKGTCKGIKSGGGQFADIPTMQSATQSKGW